MAKRHRWGKRERRHRRLSGARYWMRQCLDCGLIHDMSWQEYRRPGSDPSWTRTAGPCEPKEKEADGG